MDRPFKYLLEPHRTGWEVPAEPLNLAESLRIRDGLAPERQPPLHLRSFHNTLKRLALRGISRN